MSDVRIETREFGSSSSGAFGESPYARAPLATRPSVNPPTIGATTSRSWWMRGLRVVRNAAIAVAVMALVPIGMVAVEGDVLARLLYDRNMNVASRVAATERVRPFRVP